MRFRISTTLIFIALLAVGLGWWVDANRRETVYYLHIYEVVNLEPEEFGTSFSINLTVNRPFTYVDSRGVKISGNLKSGIGEDFQLSLVSSLGSGFSHDGVIEIDEMHSPSLFMVSGRITFFYFVVSQEPDFNAARLKAGGGKTS